MPDPIDVTNLIPGNGPGEIPQAMQSKSPPGGLVMAAPGGGPPLPVTPHARTAGREWEKKQIELLQSGVTAGAATGIGLLAPEAVGAAASRFLPQFANALRFAGPSMGELLEGVGTGAGQAMLATKTSQAGRGTPYQPLTEAASLGIDLAGPWATNKLLRRLGPDVVPQTQEEARRAEKLGFRMTPQQLREHGAVPHSTVHNNQTATRLLTGEAGTSTRHIDDAWLGSTESKISSKYDGIFAPHNILALSIGSADQLVDTVLTPLRRAQQAGHVTSELEKAADKFAQESLRIAPFLTQPSVVPFGTGMRANPNFIAPHGEQLRGARDLIRGLQGSENPEIRHYGNQVWEEFINVLQSSDPKLTKDLLEANKQWRTYRLIDDMHKDGHVVQGAVDLKWLNDKLSGGPGSKNYRHGGDQSMAAELARFGRDLNIVQQPPPKPPSRAWEVGQDMVVGGGLGAGGSYLYGDKPFSQQSAMDSAIGALTYPAVKRFSAEQMAPIFNAAGRAVQRIPRTAQEDMANRSRYLRWAASTRQPIANVLGSKTAEATERKNEKK